MQSRVDFEKFIINEGTTLKLDAASVRVNEVDLLKLGKFLRLHPQITALDLSNQSISLNGCLTVAHMLRDDRVLLKSLNLSQAGIDCQGAAYIARVLTKNTKLRELNLSGNLIKEDGASELADSLSVKNSITILILSHNQINQRMVVFLRHAFDLSGSLEKIDLSYQSGNDKVLIFDRRPRIDVEMYARLAVPAQDENNGLSTPNVDHYGDELVAIDACEIDFPAVDEECRKQYYLINIESYYAHHAILWNENEPDAPALEDTQVQEVVVAAEPGQGKDRLTEIFKEINKELDALTCLLVSTPRPVSIEDDRMALNSLLEHLHSEKAAMYLQPELLSQVIQFSKMREDVRKTSYLGCSTLCQRVVGQLTDISIRIFYGIPLLDTDINCLLSVPAIKADKDAVSYINSYPRTTEFISIDEFDKYQRPSPRS